MLGIALGVPVVTAAAGEDTAGLPGAPIEVGERVTVATVYPWQPVDAGDAHAIWQLGANQIVVEVGDFDGTSGELLGAVEESLRSAATTFATGDVELLPVFGYGAVAVHQPFVATFRGSAGEVAGPDRPVEGLLAAMATEGRAVTFVALAPEGGFGLIRDDVMATLSAIERVDR